MRPRWTRRDGNRHDRVTGANAFIALAEARGLCREAGLAVDFTAGRSAHTAAERLATEGFDAAYGDLNDLRYRDVCPVFYGSALLVSPRLLRDQPDAVARHVATCRRGIVATAADPDAAIAAVLDRNRSGDRDIERERCLGTLHDDMGCASGVRAGLGDIDRSRLDTSIRLLADTEGWRRVTSPDRIFTQRFSSVR